MFKKSHLVAYAAMHLQTLITIVEDDNDITCAGKLRIAFVKRMTPVREREASESHGVTLSLTASLSGVVSEN